MKNRNIFTINEKISAHADSKMRSSGTKSRKGFTLIELVIVIAILAIISAIAIPVIVTSINSSKLSVMESDCSSIQILLDSAVTEYDSGACNTVYNGHVICGNTKISDILKEHHMENVEFSREIGGIEYHMAWEGGNLSLSPSSTHLITNDTTVFELRSSY